MIVSRPPYDNPIILYINDQPIERMKFKYLGFTFNNKWDNNGKVKTRATMVKATFSRYITLATKNASKF